MRRTTAQRQRAFRAGRMAETLCVWALRLKGYRILARNWKTAAGEADIVARRGGLIAFVEVKARASHAAGIEAVSVRQQRRVRRAAEIFMAAHPSLASLDMRFDIMTIAPGSWPTHSPGAWGYE
ncbi:YraN family protein [Iodidimonas sp. SYSU 1G8]|uniref:YraN family protein n=1 Tax=Iodidimonas sp. SYSU 1G8 TaxID=3133967 RepID=UPI0031FF0E73